MFFLSKMYLRATSTLTKW